MTIGPDQVVERQDPAARRGEERRGAAPARSGGAGDSPPLVDRVLAPFHRFARLEASGGIVLLVCTAVALAWANSPWAGAYHHLWEQELSVSLGGLAARASLHAVINDGLMAVFFFLVGLEIKREVLVGELASARRAALPVAAAFGGMVVPAAIYALLNARGPGHAGWGVPMATDIAFALGVLALVGDRVPPALRVFLAALAIADDIGAVLVIAVFYTGGVAWAPLGAAALLILLSFGANLAGVRRPWVYAAIGTVLWAAVLASGVHATVAGVLLAFTIPVRTRVNETEFLTKSMAALDDFERALDETDPESAPLAHTVLSNSQSQEALHTLEELCEQAQPPLHRIEHALHGVVAFGIMPLFALSNAGVALAGGAAGAAATSPVALGALLGLVVGKPIGITLFAWLAVRARVAALPAGVGWRALAGVACLGGIGFTMALFVAGLAFPGAPALLAEAKLGVFAASFVAGALGAAALRRLPAPR